MCCGYGNDGLGTVGFDCVMVPGAVNNANTDVGSNVCGRTTVAGGFGAGASICCEGQALIIPSYKNAKATLACRSNHF